MDTQEVIIVDLPRYWTIIRRSAWWIVPLTALVTLGTWLYARQLPKVYVASTKIMAPQRAGPSLTDGRGDSLLGLAAAAIGPQAPGTPALFLAYLESRAMADAMVGALRGTPGLSAQGALVQATVDGAEFRLNKAGTLIEVRVQSPYPGLAALAANLYPVELDRMLRASLTEEAGANRRFLEARLLDAQKALPRSRPDFDLSPQEALVQALTIQLAQTRMLEARDLPTVQVLDRATVPRWPVGPPVRRTVQYAGILSLVALCLVAVGWDTARRRSP